MFTKVLFGFLFGKKTVSRGYSYLLFLLALLAFANGSYLQAQTYAPIQPLYFVKTFGGVNPLPQVVPVTSVGTQIGVTVTAATSTGGNWLSVTSLGCCSSTPQAPTVTVNAVNTLAAGTYLGQLVFATTGQSITVPVMLIVVPAATAYFDNLPGLLSFSFKTLGATPPSQTIQVRNATAGSLAWTVTASTADGGAWLSPNVTSGVAPTRVSVSIVKGNLPGFGTVARTFTGQLRFQSASATVTVPVSVTVGDDVISQQNPISFTKIFGGPNPLPQVLTIGATNNNFGITATFATSRGGNWLDLSSLGCCSSTPSPLTVSIVAPLTLAEGTYTGEIIVRADNMAAVIPVSLTVTLSSAPIFSNLPGQLSYSVKTGESSTPSQFINIGNAGQGILDWTLTATTADGGNWLSASALSGTTPAGPINIGVSVLSLPFGGLIPGTFTGQLLIESAGSSITVPISVVVGDNVFSPVIPLSFTKTFQGQNPLPQTLTIASRGASLGFTGYASTANGGNWLSINSLGCCSSTPETVTVSINADSSLAVGTYTGEVVLNGPGMAQVIPVNLVVRPATAARLASLPGQISFFVATGSGNPPAQTLNVRNAGGGTLDWNLSFNTSDGGSWLSVSAPSGTAPSVVTVSVTALNLPYQGLVPGTFTGTLNFQNVNSTTSIPVSVIVASSVFVPIGPLTFSKAVGGPNPAPQPLNITATGASLGYTVGWSTADGGSWLSVTGAGCCNNTPSVVNVGVNADAGLAAGIYSGQIVLSNAGESAMTIPVRLNVGNVPTMAQTKVSVYNSGIWTIDLNGNGIFDGGDRSFAYIASQPGDVAVTGDWNGDGRQKVGIYRNGFWILDYNGNGIYDYDGSPTKDRFYAFGGPATEFTPIVGDWTGDGKTKIGYFRGGFWVLDFNGNGAYDGVGLSGDRIYGFGGNAGEVPVIGDWNRDGRMKIGLFYRGSFLLDYNGDGSFTIADKYYPFVGVNASDKPLVGDWSGDGSSKIGVFRDGFWILDYDGNGAYTGQVQDRFFGFGGPNDKPIVGDWNGDGKSKIGAYRNGFWFLDYNGNGSFDGVGVGLDRFIGFGGAVGEQPITTNW